MKCIIIFTSDEIKNARNKEEEIWALEAGMKIYDEAVERILNPLIPEYNELWDDIDTHIMNDDGTINDKVPYNKRYEEFQKAAYDAMSYIYGVDPKTQRILKLDPPFILVNDQKCEGRIFGHIEDYNMEYKEEEAA